MSASGSILELGLPANPTKARWRLEPLACAFFLVAALSCGHKSEPVPIIVAPLGGDTVARVGEAAIPASFVARVAAAQHLDPRRAALLLIDDALAAQGATMSGLDRDPALHWQLLSTRARITVTHIHDAAHAAGAPNDAELVELTARRWREFDLPEQIRVVHAVAHRPSKPNADAEARAKSIAEQIARAVSEASGSEDFMARANTVPAGDVTVTIQPLPAFVSDGRISEPQGGALDEAFATAAFALPAGSTSRVVETKFGWHVIRAVERIPASPVATEQRRAALTEDAYAMRAYKTLEARLLALHQEYPVEISTASEALMSAVAAEAFAQRPAAAP